MTEPIERSGTRRKVPSRRPTIGWREWVTLPDLCETPMKAKVDTGARTSALHAFDLEVTGGLGTELAIFDIHPLQRSTEAVERVKLPVIGFKVVRSSSGHSERRPVVRTEVQVGPHRWPVEFTLTRRDEMGFRMLLGRTAIRRRFLVDPGRSYQQGEKQ